MAHNKVIVIGLDGATFDVIEPMAERGWLPNIARLMGEGVRGELQSTIQPITPQAWSTFLTGTNAGKHGIFDFMGRREGSYEIEFVNAGRRVGGSMFSYLSRGGLRVGVVAVPFTYPPEEINGFMLSGFDAPAEDERAVYPRELYEEIRNRFGHYYIHLASPVGRRNDPEKFWSDIQTEDKNRTDITLHLMDRYPCDFVMTTYYNTDRTQHQYLTYEFLDELRKMDGQSARENLVARTYENVDREVGRLLEKVDGDTTVIVVSDHGSGPIKRVFFLNRWLEEQGFLAYRRSSGKGLAVVERARKLAKRLLPRWAKGILKGALVGVRDRVESYRYFSEIDWDKTKAYGFGSYGNIFINLEGREPRGVVPREDFEKTCGEIAEALMALQDPDTGELLVERVYRRDELYEGPASGKSPDLVICWRDYAYFTSTSPGREDSGCFGGFLKIDSSDFDHVGTHRLNGVFIASGANVRKGGLLTGASIADVAPSVLFALGQAIPAEMDGKVLFDVFTEEFLNNRLPEYAASGDKPGAVSRRADYTDEESRSVAERLKGLGYL